MTTQNALITRLPFATLIALCFISVSCGPHPPGMLVVTMETPPKIDLNTATKSELMTLPGIGEMKAQSIIRGRPYDRIADLWKLEGFGQKTMANLRDKVTVNEINIP